MTPHSTRFEELLPAYALGALEGDELRELEEHLAAGCAECRPLLALWQEDLADLAGSVPPLPAPAGLREKVLAAAAPAGAGSPEPSSAVPAVPGRGAAAPAAAPAARSAFRWLLPIAALLLVALWGVMRQASLGEDVARLSQDLDTAHQHAAALGRQLAEARGENRRMAKALQIIAAPGVQAIALAGLGPTPRAVGHTFVNRAEGKAMFYAFDLPPLAPDKTYELWFIDPSGPVAAGLFHVDPQGMASVEVDNVAPAQPIVAWAVTVEPSAGVPKPTGPMVLKG